MSASRAERGFAVATTFIACGWTLRVLDDTDVRVVLAAWVCLAAIVGPRLSLSTFVQRVVLLACAGLALGVRRVMLGVPLQPSGSLSGIFADLSLAAIMTMAARLTMREAEWGPPVSISLGFAALLADGQVRVGSVYGPVVAAFLLSGAAWSHAHDPARPSLGAALRARKAHWFAAFALTAALSIGGAVALPRLHDRLLTYLGDRYRCEVASAGFNDRMTLDALDGMLTSDEVALRVYGPVDDYLRGAVFNRYMAGRWMVAGNPHERRIAALAPSAPSPARVEIRRVEARPGWYFAPMHAIEMATEHGDLGVGRFGMLHPAQGDTGTVFSYTAGPRVEAAIDPPEAADLVVPERLRERLQPFVARWTSSTDAPGERAARIAVHLSREYEYSLSSPRRASLDPVLDFLLVHKRGHCEYFASALALLCREAGVPARVVAGYRVFERSPLGGHAIVRERNAHAWVEVWTNGQWHTLDATPGGAIRPHRSAWSRGYQTLADIGLLASERARAWLRALTPWETAGMIALGALWIALGRAWRARKARGAARSEEAPSSAPLACWLSLESALRRRGLTRAPYETLESFAERLRADGSLREQGTSVADAVERYAALRYGDVGEPERVARSLESLAAKLGEEASTPQDQS